ncbi:MAG: GNAT family N-acetyltransferase [Calditrichae bacterium]|nr:GNAT family N-acetyltransferase [Calditrichia bacterium]
MTETMNAKLQFHPLSRDRWDDLQTLFGERGACGGCWCMWWKMKNSEFEQLKGEGNRKALKAIVNSGQQPGILAYLDDEPIGWCAVEPREKFSRFSRSRILKPVDDEPVWSVVCFFVDKRYRNKGLTVQLLKAAIDHVKMHGGKIIEGYPVEPKSERMPDVFAYYGLAKAFREAGFVECARRSQTRPIMRYYIK